MKKVLIACGLVLALGACKDQAQQADNANGQGNDQSAPINPTEIQNPATADQPDVSDADLPVIAFEKEIYEFPGEIMEGEKVSYSFKFNNAGKSDLIIADASAPCGCTVPYFSKEPIAPGKSGKIDVEFNSEGKPGRNEKAVIVTSNTIPKTKELRIVVNVKPKAQ